MVHLHATLAASAVYTTGISRGEKASGSSFQALANRRPTTFTQTLHNLSDEEARTKVALDAESGRTIDASQNPAANRSVTAQPTVASDTVSTTTPAYLIGFNALVPRNTPTASVASTPSVVPQDSVATTSLTPVIQQTDDSSTVSPFKHWYADNAADDAYWSQQPAAVQQLREIQNPQQRQALAAQLASQGYTIDNAIMVWGWDAGQVTTERQADGYTWVPSATQASISAAPGLTGPGITPYNANNPPAGSIIVPPATSQVA